MSKKIKIDWSESLIIDGKLFPKDRLNRAKYAEFLTGYLSSQGFDPSRTDEEKRNYVINLNSGWGAGKTFFLKRWEKDLANHYPVVYVDAWQKDYSDDPLMTVFSAIISSLRKQSGKDSDLIKVPPKILGLLKAAAPGLARGISKKVIGVDLLDLLGNSDTGDNSDETKPIDLSNAASEAVSYLLKEHDSKGKAIDSLKKAVLEWVKVTVNAKELSFPAFILIDELDRCRPSYAIEMLETIKHIFDIPGVVFVVATDTEQLQHVVKSVYGIGFDARLYLGRFFNSRFSLKSPDLSNFLDVHCDSYVFSQDYLTSKYIEILPCNNEASCSLENIAIVLDSFQVPARTAIQIADRIIATIENLPNNSAIDLIMLTTLHCIKEIDNELFEDVALGKFKRLKENGKEWTLYDYVFELVNDRGGVLKMWLEPQEITEHLRAHKFIRPNRYPSALYEFSYSDYLEKIFFPFFDDTSGFSGFLDFSFSKDDSPTKLESAALELYQNESSSSFNTDLSKGQSGILWLRYFYCSEPFNGISKSHYHDLVELSSALDWLDEGEV